MGDAGQALAGVGEAAAAVGGRDGPGGGEVRGEGGRRVFMSMWAWVGAARRAVRRRWRVVMLSLVLFFVECCRVFGELRMMMGGYRAAVALGSR